MSDTRKTIIDKFKKRFEQLACAQLSDAAIERIIPLPNYFKSYGKKVKMCGPLFSVNTENDMLPAIQAIASAPKGSVIFINNTASSANSEALIGEIYANTAIKYEMSGICVNGAIRDIHLLKSLELPIYAKEVTFVSSKVAKKAAKKVPEPIEIEGILIEPSDWLFADEDGLLIVRAADLRAVLLAAEFINKRETDLLSAIRSGQRLEKLIGLNEFLAGKSDLRFSF